jgi:hypothetical protein
VVDQFGVRWRLPTTAMSALVGIACRRGAQLSVFAAGRPVTMSRN